MKKTKRPNTELVFPFSLYILLFSINEVYLQNFPNWLTNNLVHTLKHIANVFWGYMAMCDHAYAR